MEARGGVFVTNDSDLYERARHYATFCRNDNIAYLWSDDIGYNYRISNVTAALILAQVERIDELIKRKKEIYDWYYEHLINVPYIEMLTPKAECTSNYAYVVGYLDKNAPIERDNLIKAMLSENIYMRPGYPSMSLMPNYERKFQMSNSDCYFLQGIVFPTAMNIDENDVLRVVDKLRFYLNV